MSRDTRTENYVSHFFSCENSVPPIPIIFSHCSDHDCFRSVSIDTQITYFHIISRQIDFSSDIRRNIMIRTKGYHSPIILIPEHVAVVTKDSITLFGQQPANFEDFTAIIKSRLLYAKLSSIGTVNGRQCVPCSFLPFTSI